MKVKAARFYDHNGRNSDWSVAIYKASVSTEKYPHEWFMFLNKREFNALGHRCPKKKETLALELTVTPCG